MIKTKSFYLILGVVALSLALVFQSGCTKNDADLAEEIEEKGTIEQMTDEAADTAVRKIRTPMDKARASQGLGDDRLESMDKALQER